MKIAIVGGSGFIGRHTTRELIRHGHKVTIFDKVDPFSNNFFWPNDSLSVRFQEVDALNLQELDYAFRRTSTNYYNSFDAVYMFAAISDSKENHIDIQQIVFQKIEIMYRKMKIYL
jgi:nucleoside-diphosphate-sugar epimerase